MIKKTLVLCCSTVTYKIYKYFLNIINIMINHIFTILARTLAIR